MKERFALVLLVASAAVGAPAWGLEKPALKGCASHSPPFMIFAENEPAAGFSYELFLDIAHQLGRTADVSLLPWARCLQEVKDGRMDMAIDAYDDLSRRKSYWYSTAYRTLTPQLFYRGNSGFVPSRVGASTDLKAYRGCGVREYTYDHYDLDATTLDRGAPDDRTMLLKLRAGHCDYAVEELEYIVGGRQFVPRWLDESELRSFRPVWARGPQLHFLIGKDRLAAHSLLQEVNQAIARSEKSGLMATLARRYLESAGQPGRNH